MWWVVSDGAVPFAWAILLLSVVMVAYESLGGMRSVAWTDVLQGLILLFGTLAIFYALVSHYGGFDSILERLRSVRPRFWEPPDTRQKLSWLSLLVLVSFGAAVYPQGVWGLGANVLVGYFFGPIVVGEETSGSSALIPTEDPPSETCALADIPVLVIDTERCRLAPHAPSHRGGEHA
jgi:Na+/proline symporter